MNEQEKEAIERAKFLVSIPTYLEKEMCKNLLNYIDKLQKENEELKGKLHEKNETKNVHEGHRERLRQKVIKNGMHSLAEHEVLELILFYSLAQRNTNDLAHKLINRFGSVAAVLDAPQEQLLEIKGISKMPFNFAQKEKYLSDDMAKDLDWWNRAIEAHNTAGMKYMVMPVSPINEITVAALFSIR